MTYTIVRHEVEDYNKWKSVFDSATQLRQANGEESAQIFRDADNPNIVTVLNKWTSIEKAKEFMNSPEIYEKMKEGGVTSQPNIMYINEE